MLSVDALRSRGRPLPLVVVSIVVVAASAFQFLYGEPVTVFTIALWVLVVPLLFAATVDGLRDHPVYYPVFSGCLIAIGLLQYLDGNWVLLAGVFVLAGIGGLAVEVRTRWRPTSS